MALNYKGKGPMSAEYAKGGPPVYNHTQDRFMKTPDTFRTSIQKQDYKKTGKGGELSKMIEKKAP